MPKTYIRPDRETTLSHLSERGGHEHTLPSVERDPSKSTWTRWPWRSMEPFDHLTFTDDQIPLYQRSLTAGQNWARRQGVSIRGSLLSEGAVIWLEPGDAPCHHISTNSRTPATKQASDESFALTLATAPTRSAQHPANESTEPGLTQAA